MSDGPQKRQPGRPTKHFTDEARLEANCAKAHASMRSRRERQRAAIAAKAICSSHDHLVDDVRSTTPGQAASSSADFGHDGIATTLTSCRSIQAKDDGFLDIEDILGTDTFFQSLHDYVKQWKDPTAAANASIDHAINKTDDNASGIATSYPIAITTTTTTPMASTASQPTTAATNAAHLTVAIPSPSKSDWATFLTADCDDGSPCFVQLHSLWSDQDDDGKEDDNYDDINNDSDRGGNYDGSDDEVVEGEGRNEGDMLECVKNIVDESTTIRLDYTTPITRKSAVSTWLKSDRKANATTTKLPCQLQSKQESSLEEYRQDTADWLKNRLSATFGCRSYHSSNQHNGDEVDDDSVDLGLKGIVD